MIKFKNTEIIGWKHAIRGMRNPMNSWKKSDSMFIDNDGDIHTYNIGEKDLDLMKQLAKSGPVHAKYRRMITVYVDIIAPLYW